MKATATTVHRLVQGSKVFLIPAFQRRYTWRRDQWQQLWDDLINETRVDHSQDDPNQLYGHFLGSIVLHPAPGPASTLMKHQVIDGQQRLTTLLLFLSALRDVRKHHQPGWNTSEIDDQYLRNAFSEEHPERLRPTRLDRESYTKTVHEGTPTGDIGIAYNFFKKNIEEYACDDPSKLGVLETTLLLHMLLVEITTKAGDSVNSIFNTLNSKGMALSPADLVRNEILHHVGEKHGEDSHQQFWIPMEVALTNSRLKNPDREFVTFLWAREVALDPSTTREALFSKFERRLRKDLHGTSASQRTEQAREALKAMHDDHLLFRLLRSPHDKSLSQGFGPELIASLIRLRQWRSEPTTPLVLWLLRQVRSGAVTEIEAAATLELLLTYLVKRSLNGIPTNQLNRLLTPLAYELSKRGDVATTENLRILLSRAGYHWPSDETIRRNAPTVSLYASARRHVPFLLGIAELHLPGHETADLQRAQIEHIMPQSLSSAWLQQFEEHGVAPEDAEPLTHTLGNLTLTESNQRMGNKPYAEKRQFFLNSALRLNREIARRNVFMPKDILERTNELIEIILGAFPHKPAAGASDARDAGVPLQERLETLLQGLPASTRTSIHDLISVLGAHEEELRGEVNSLDPTLVRLIREKDGTVPGWLRPELREEVAKQNLAVGDDLLEEASPEKLAQILSSEDEEDEEDEEDRPVDSVSTAF